jgi:membrane fusion protein, multidrug efflux system
VKLRATFNNPDLILFPNQFVNVLLLVDTLKNADLVPTAAIQRGEPGTFVYVVKPDQTVAAQPVSLGPSNNQQVAVTKGVQPGQLVVIDGADRLKDGAKVKIAEATTPSGVVAPAGRTPQGKSAPRQRQPGQGGGQHGQPSGG